MTDNDVKPVKTRVLSLAGRPPARASTFLAKSRPILAARWVRSCKRALQHLNDPKAAIDANWIRLFNSLADRIGYARVSEQRVDSTSISATMDSTSFMASLAARAKALEAHFGRPLPALLADLGDGNREDGIN